MSKGQIQQQIRSITHEIQNYINLLYITPYAYTRNALLNMIRDRLYFMNFLISILNEDTTLTGIGTTSSNPLSDSINTVQGSMPISSETGIEQLTQGIQPSGLYNIITVPSQTSQGNQAIFTLEQLSRYNGINGNPAYVAVNGVVYDLTNNAQWAAATHFGLVAGRDLTQEFASCHAGQNILSKLKIVGRLSQ